MSAPHIPNLLGRRGGPRQRGGRGRGTSSNASQFVSPNHRKDLAIQATDTDAAVSRLSAVSLGYLDDPFASLFVGGSSTRRMPVINRGTYARTTAIDLLINAFISPGQDGEGTTRQIISLGAGTDTRYFRLRAKQQHKNLIYHEFDFSDVSNVKYALVGRHEELGNSVAQDILFRNTPDTSDGLPDQEPEWGFERLVDGVEETRYCFHPMDLRQLVTSSTKGLQSFRGIRSDVPTLLISECCLCYLNVDVADGLVKFFTDSIPSLGIILYEPIGGDDAFGQTMVNNLAARNISMPTVQKYKTLSDQKSRLETLGFSNTGGEGGSNAVNIETIWDVWVSATERRRVDMLEGLDEIEEWQVLARHYAIVWGWKGDGWNGWSKFYNS